MHENKSDFMRAIEEIRLAENEADKLKAEAKEKSDHILKKAKEDVLKIKSEIEQEVVDFKTKKLQEGSNDIEAEVEQILKKAKEESDSIRNRKLGKKILENFFDEFLNSDK